VETWVGLLRGINVGRHRRVAMPALRDALRAAGFAEVRTLGQSGNVLFEWAGRDEQELTGNLEGVFATAFGFAVTVVVRPAAEVAGLAERSPFLAAGAPSGQLHVLFPVAVPDPASLASLGALDPGDDAFAAVGREVHLRLPNGLTGARLTYEVLERHLGPATVRNWNTVAKLAAAARV
jgi:uncharacterized protein (DUF1697 family)